MLFVLVMDVLNNLFIAAKSIELLQGLDGAGVQNRLSIYADDVVLLFKPILEDLNCVRLILDCFGAATGLITNLRKSLPFQ
jgi:hypothetical protein